MGLVKSGMGTNAALILGEAEADFSEVPGIQLPWQLPGKPGDRSSGSARGRDWAVGLSLCKSLETAERVQRTERWQGGWGAASRQQRKAEDRRHRAWQDDLGPSPEGSGKPCVEELHQQGCLLRRSLWLQCRDMTGGRQNLGKRDK